MKCIYILLALLLTFHLCDAQEKSEDRIGLQVLTLEQINDYKSRLRDVAAKDQERIHKNWEKQNRLDSLNRVELDILYLTYGFPEYKTIGKESFISLIMVVHHSSDCEWNEKWLKILFLNSGELLEFKTLLRFMIQRTYGKEMGICKLSESTKKDLIFNVNEEVLIDFNILELLKISN